MPEPDRPIAETDPEFLARYAEESRTLLVSRTRLAIAFSIVAYPGFWFLDRWAAPDYAMDFLGVRLCVVGFYVFILAMLTRPVGRRVAGPLSIGGVYVSGLGICLMIPLMGGFESDYYIGVMLIVFVSGLVFAWSARATLVCGGLIVASYFAVNFLFGMPIPANVYHLAAPAFFLTASVVFAAFGNYGAGRGRRQDLALRMRVEKHATQLRELDEAKTRFFSNVSHELRTPLTLILGPLESILQGRERGDFRPLLEAMDSNARRLLRQVNAILDFSKLDAGKLKLDLGRNNAGVLLKELVDAAVPHAQRKGVTLCHEGCDDLPDSIFDLGKIETVAANLISNALKFTIEGSVTVRAGSDDARIWFAVEDSGPGIPADQLGRVFERFQQVDNSMSRRVEGTGLGLAMVKELAELHGGCVTLESEVGRGSTFRIELPRAPQVAADRRVQPDDGAGRSALPAASRGSARQTLLADVAGGRLAALEPTGAHEGGRESAPTAPDGAFHVLIVEDNPDLRAFVARSLASRYRITTAADGVEGFEAAKSVRPDLIVSDIMMPRMNGYELCRRVRQEPGLTRIPLILVTAKSGAEAVVEGLEVGADDYLTKPFDIRELDARIEAHLRSVRLERSLGERDSRLAAIGQMTSSIVHDLRGPLVSVVGFAELAQMTATKAGHGTLGEQLGTVIAEAQRVARMVQEVLDFARGGATTLQRRAVPLRAFLDPIAGALRETVESLGIEIVVDHDPDERLALSLDKDRMHRVIENLVKNAREALSGKGMDAYGKHIWIATRKGGETVTIRVADDGPGIPEEVREKLFTPFASHGKEKGTGLGLATVRNLVLAHGGQVHVESPAPEGGAAFVLTFPAMQAAAKKPRPHAESAPASQPSPPADVAATA